MRTTSPPVQVPWSNEWAYEKAAQAMRYLATHYPECASLEALDSYQEAVHQAATAEDRDGYEEALREYMRHGRQAALAIRRGAA